MNRENLIKMADYLLQNDLKADFHMSAFTDNEHCLSVHTNCGTVGCVIGHGPYAGIEKHMNETWLKYSDRVFLNDCSKEWAWCFSFRWSAIDNTAIGAAKRIYYLLEHGLPSSWDGNPKGIFELCYLNQQPVKE